MPKQPIPDWSREIQSVLRQQHWSQNRLAELLGVSPATVNRWIKGTHEPTAGAYMALGNLVGLPAGGYFWERAGLDPENFADKTLRDRVSSLRITLKDLQIVTARRLSKQLVDELHDMVLVPLLNAKAYGDTCPPGPPVNLATAEIVDIFIAPLKWCPHPESVLCLTLSGDSMAPVIPDGSMICVDTSVTDRQQLDRKIAVFSHRDEGFKVARLRCLPSSDILISANHSCMPMDVSDPSKWKPIGEVIWWLSRDSVGTT